jgi:hypothetical protein
MFVSEPLKFSEFGLKTDNVEFFNFLQLLYDLHQYKVMSLEQLKLLYFVYIESYIDRDFQLLQEAILKREGKNLPMADLYKVYEQIRALVGLDYVELIGAYDDKKDFRYSFDFSSEFRVIK